MSKFNINGPFIYISIDANGSSRDIKIDLPVGYTYERIFINRAINISSLFSNIDIHTGDRLTFPVVNSKSPSTLRLFIPDLSKPAEIRLTIEKFGQIPDPTYFDKPFDPILVTGGDNSQYLVIPSDQFK
jgi:hypothetical protein